MSISDEDMEARIETIERNLTEIRMQLDKIEHYLVRADKTIATIAEQVMPTITELTNSPMLKMFMGKKK